MTTDLNRRSWPRRWRGRVWEGTLRGLSSALGPHIARPLDASRLGKILVLQLQQLGDSVVFTPVLRALRQRFPAARLDMFCNAVSYELYRKCPYVDRFHVGSWTRGPAHQPGELLGILRSIRAERYELCVADVTQTAALYGAVALLTGAPRRIGFDVKNRGFLYTTRLPRPDQQNYIDCNLTIARALGAGSPTPVVECFFDEADRESMDELLASEGVRPPIIAIHAASNWQAKLWFRERWASLADALAERHGASMLFVGTNREREYIEGIIARMRERAYSAVGRTSLAQLGALISRCSLFIGTDSGPRHIAAGVGCPQVTLMSSQDRPERWQFGHAREVVLRTDPKCSPCFQTYCWHRRCMSNITEAMAMDACASLLAAPMAPAHANAAP